MTALRQEPPKLKDDEKRKKDARSPLHGPPVQSQHGSEREAVASCGGEVEVASADESPMLWARPRSSRELLFLERTGARQRAGRE